jgi:large subunit ribosomal protein L3
MSKGLLGKKIGMTQVFAKNGDVIPVTVVEVGPCVVMQIKDEKVDGYQSIQLGYDDVKLSRQNKPEKGHAKKANTTPKRFVREIRDVNIADYNVGQALTASVFNQGEFVDVTGTSKGKGFTGAIKRFNQSRGPMSNGFD